MFALNLTCAIARLAMRIMALCGEFEVASICQPTTCKQGVPTFLQANPLAHSTPWQGDAAPKLYVHKPMHLCVKSRTCPIQIENRACSRTDTLRGRGFGIRKLDLMQPCSFALFEAVFSFRGVMEKLHQIQSFGPSLFCRHFYTSQ